MNISAPEQLTDLHLVRYIKRPPSHPEFVLSQDFAFSYRGDGALKHYRVPADFETDLSSVPRAARWFASKTDAIEPSVIHDWFYNSREVSREEADDVFLAFMELDGVAWFRRQVMYRAVRLFGAWAYST